MKEPKKGRCLKCGIMFYMHEHHILPKSIFGKKSEKVKLCPNCHTHFHVYSNINTKNKGDIKEAKAIWKKWLETVSVVVTFFVALFLITYFLK